MKLNGERNCAQDLWSFDLQMQTVCHLMHTVSISVVFFSLCHFQSPFISHGHRYHYSNTQLCKCGEMEMIVSLLWFDLFDCCIFFCIFIGKWNKKIRLTLLIQTMNFESIHSFVAHANPRARILRFILFFKVVRSNQIRIVSHLSKSLQSESEVLIFRTHRLIYIQMKGAPSNCVFSSVNCKIVCSHQCKQL